MNMKKTIAAVAACAMAVSAMATTVSADTAYVVPEGYEAGKTLTYDLTKKTKTQVVDFEFQIKDYNAKVDKLQFAVAKDVVSEVPQTIDVTVKNKGGSTVNSYSFTFSADTGNKNYQSFVTKGTKTINGKSYYTLTVDLANGGAWASNATLAASISKAFDPTSAGSNDGLLDIVVTTEKLNTNVKDNNNSNLNDTQMLYATGARVAYVNNGVGYYGVFADMSGNPLYDKTVLAGYNNGTGSGLTYWGQAQMQTAGTMPLAYFDITPDVAAGTDHVLGLPKFNLGDETKKEAFMTGVATNSNTTGKHVVFDALNETNGRLGEDGTLDYGKHYKNAAAVINDMIAVYDDVVFTFNCVSDKVNDAGVYGSGDERYKTFPQDLYNLFGDDNKVDYVYSDDYAFNNLFRAALVANNGYTMQQNSIDPFVYNKSSVSFSWNDMTGGKDVASPATAALSLQLMTSSKWFWESMVVTGYNVEADDAVAGEGAEGGGETIDDGEDTDDTDIDDTEDTDIDDTDVDDTTDVDDVDTDDTTDVDDVDTDDTGDVDADTSNPETGNAPIALAVIPVALAAAAVVAKKRG